MDVSQQKNSDKEIFSQATSEFNFDDDADQKEKEEKEHQQHEL